MAFEYITDLQNELQRVDIAIMKYTRRGISPGHLPYRAARIQGKIEAAIQFEARCIVLEARKKIMGY